MQSKVYKMICFSEMSLSRANILPDLILLTLPPKWYADHTPGIFEHTLKSIKPRTLVDCKQYFWCHRWLFLSKIYLLLQVNSLLLKGSLLLEAEKVRGYFTHMIKFCILTPKRIKDYMKLCIILSSKEGLDTSIHLIHMICIWKFEDILFNVSNYT